MTEEGRSCFGSLQRAVAERDQSRLAYYAFDLLHLDHCPLYVEPLEQRKAALSELIPGGAWNLRYLDHITGSGPEFFTLACDQHLEGIISKRAGSIYRPGKRSQSWLKSKSRSYAGNVAWQWWEEKGHHD